MLSEISLWPTSPKPRQLKSLQSDSRARTLKLCLCGSLAVDHLVRAFKSKLYTGLFWCWAAPRWGKQSRPQWISPERARLPLPHFGLIAKSGMTVLQRVFIKHIQAIWAQLCSKDCKLMKPSKTAFFVRWCWVKELGIVISDNFEITCPV